MKKSVLITFFFNAFLGLCTSGQQRTDVNSVDNLAGQGLYYAINGEPFVSTKFSKVVEGSPFFNDEWMKGTVILSGGKQYNNLSLKINLLEGTLIYLNDQEVEMVAIVPVKEVILTDILTGKNFRFIHSRFICTAKGKSWYSILDSGRIQLVRNEIRILKENKPYGSATIEQLIHNQPEYFLLTTQHCSKVKNAEELTKQLNLLDPEFGEKAKSLGVKGKTEKAFLQLTNLYNSDRTSQQ